ncbi:hypothetical protein GCM10010347_64550 [Streptomyces cirratus]|uniref:Type I-E CRISPR-associated protein Cse2/CasB n=1 Tax=Streptomyces cirratus TaxID=68187 RepID=A0ABQ3F597_9ACTN|nr:type I-E CRISPR-associated protein Cse2/CasB [Streptomyces cirratus]GHB84675.1 hypothetical protein GCM10010347_64550 [Streptomyces cirratus]
MNTTTSARTGAGKRPHFWETFVPGPGHPLRNLAALRAGVGREPGTVPQMRPLYRVQVTDADQIAGRTTVALAAEHAALTLFGVHQQGRPQSVHQPGRGLGAACRALKASGRFSPAAVDRNISAAASSLDLHELHQHLRGLVQKLRIAGLGMDYTRLYFDLRAWQREPEHERRVRAWGLQYVDLARQDPTHPGPDDDRPYWESRTALEPGSGADLAALRAGMGREAGTVPQLWPLYRARIGSFEQNTGAPSPTLDAEHVALALFGVHQQGRRTAMHSTGVDLGQACRRVRASEHVSEEAFDRRFGNLLTSTDAAELQQHLRGLIPQLRDSSQPLDYTRLMSDLRNWDIPERQTAIRRRWDRTYRSSSSPTA